MLPHTLHTTPRSARCRHLVPLLACALAACDAPPVAPEDPSLARFEGVYELRTIDGMALPRSVDVSFGAFSIRVGSGSLSFAPQNRWRMDAAGLLDAGPDNVTMSAVTAYERIDPDSLHTSVGLLGHVRGDTAEVHSLGSTAIGEHVWVFVRKRGS